MNRAGCILRILTLVIVLAGQGVARATTPKAPPQDLTVHSWTKNQGLPDNFVTAVLQSRDGYLWVGTPSGLVRFDGIKFTAVPLRGKGIPVPRVTTLCEDRRGRLWIGTQGGGLLYYANGAICAFNGNDRLLDQTVTSLAADTEGNLWISTPSGLNRFDGRRLARLTAQDGLPNDSVSSVYAAQSGTVWITTHGGMCQYKKGKIIPADFQPEGQSRSPGFIGVYEDQQRSLWAFGDTYLVNLSEGKRFNYFRTGDTSALRIWSICEGHNGQLWIGTSGEGLYCFADGKFMPPALREGRLPADVRAICEDREGNLWLGTYDSGLVCLQPRGVRFIESNQGLPARTSASCLAAGLNNRLWVGMEHGGVFSGSVDRFDHFEGLETLNLATSLCVGPDGSLWAGTFGTGLCCSKNGKTIRYTTAHGLSDNAVLAVATDSTGMIWAGTRSGGVHCLTSEGITASFETQMGAVCAILPAQSGGVWIGTENGGLFRANTNDFFKVREATPLLNSAICALEEDAAGRLWVGTLGGGLSCLTHRRLHTWLKESGLPDDRVLAIVCDADDYLWLQSGKGICRISQAQVEEMLSGVRLNPLTVLLESEAAELDVGWPRGARTADGRVWFATANGVVTCDPRSLQNAVAPPPVQIEAILANDQPVEYSVRSETVHLPADLRSLEVQFTALSFTDPQRTRFRHKLEGLDPDWVESGGERRVRYSRLPYGNYRFRVKAANAEGCWNETGVGFAFTISTPPWRSWWALALYGLTAAGAVASTVRLVSYRRWNAKLARSRAQRAMEKERVRIAQDMHDEIGSKLTKISFLSERARHELRDSGPATDKIESIAVTSRELLRSLDEIVWAVNPRNDHLEHLAAYLGQYAVEYLQNTSLECELHIPPQLPNMPLSAEVRHNLFLAFEESLTNALKHARATLLRIEMTVEPARFKIVISDNGCGFVPPAPRPQPAESEIAPPRRRGGNGLGNLRQRLASMGGECIIDSKPGQGTAVTLSIPISKSKKA